MRHCRFYTLCRVCNYVNYVNPFLLTTLHNSPPLSSTKSSLSLPLSLSIWTTSIYLSLYYCALLSPFAVCVLPTIYVNDLVRKWKQLVNTGFKTSRATAVFRLCIVWNRHCCSVSLPLILVHSLSLYS